MKECTTHHKACDCLEEATRKLVDELVEHARYSCGSITMQRLLAEAVRLGYAQGRSYSKACDKSATLLQCIRCGTTKSVRWTVCVSTEGTQQTFCRTCHRDGYAGGFSYIGDAVYTPDSVQGQAGKQAAQGKGEG